MAKRGKRYQDAVKTYDKAAIYDAPEALKIVKENAKAKFDETIEAHVRLGVDPKHADQQVRGTLLLPHGTGKTKTILVFAREDREAEAKEAGADYVGGDELATKIQGGWLDFDVVIATPDMMGVVGKLGRVLGPRGLMPNPKIGTVTPDISKAIEEIKAGKIEFRVDKASIVHVPIGKASFDDEKLLDNFNSFVEALNKARPAAAKGTYMRSFTVKSTMGPGVRVNAGKLTR